MSISNNCHISNNCPVSISNICNSNNAVSISNNCAAQISENCTAPISNNCTAPILFNCTAPVSNNCKTSKQYTNTLPSHIVTYPSTNSKNILAPISYSNHIIQQKNYLLKQHYNSAATYPIQHKTHIKSKRTPHISYNCAATMFHLKQLYTSHTTQLWSLHLKQLSNLDLKQLCSSHN